MFPHFFFGLSFFLDLSVSLVLLHFHDLLFSFSYSDLTSLLLHPLNIPHSSFLLLILPFPWISCHVFVSISSGKQTTHKNPEEYSEPSVERNADVSWHHSSRHDHQNTQVGAQLWLSPWPVISIIPQTVKWPVYYAEDEDPCFQSSSELPAAVYASQWAFPGNSLLQPGDASQLFHLLLLL